MSSSAPDTQGQITVAELAKGVCARIVDADVTALEAGCTIGSFDALTTPRPAMRASPSGVNSRLHLGLWQADQRTGIEPGIDATGGKDECTCFAAGRGDCAEALATGRDDVCIPPPVTAEIDGKAATLVVCHGRPGSRMETVHREVCRADGLPVAGTLAIGDHVLLGNGITLAVMDGIPDAGIILLKNASRSGPTENLAGHSRLLAAGRDVGGDGLGHFGLLPLISRGAEGKQFASHELNYTHETKERKNIFELFFGGCGESAKPYNVELRGASENARSK